MRFKTIFSVLAGALFIVGCQQPPPLPTPQPSECSPTEAEIIWPELQAVQPEQILAGGEIIIIASGGYQIECGNFYNESQRLFAVHISNEPVGSLSCMVNHCEAKLKVPVDLMPGTHTISAEGGSQIEIEIIKEGAFEVLEWEEEFPASEKGYELYSWLEEDRWHFTLISGTNRSKTSDEILSPDSFITPDGWVKITVSGVQDLKSVLDNLPDSQEVFWLEGTRVEGAGGDNPASAPDQR
jgi:hypothetical protein